MKINQYKWQQQQQQNIKINKKKKQKQKNALEINYYRHAYINKIAWLKLRVLNEIKHLNI